MNGIPATMLAVRRHGDDDLRLDTVPTPAPAIGDVLVDVRAAGFTPTELGWPSTLADRLGRARGPVVPGHELSGVVVAHGPGTARFAVGDAVFGIADWYRDGALADYVAVEARNLARKPPGLSHEAAAVLSLAGLTAQQALFDHGRLQAGRRVLILGAAGGVGHLAVRLARLAGAHVVAADRPRRREALILAGAHEVAGEDLAGLDPVDLIVDLVGGAAVGQALRRLAPGGRAVSVVDDAVRDHAGGVYFVVAPDGHALTALAARAAAGELEPQVGATSPLGDALEAIAAKQRRAIRGKLVVTAGA